MGVDTLGVWGRNPLIFEYVGPAFIGLLQQMSYEKQTDEFCQICLVLKKVWIKNAIYLSSLWFNHQCVGSKDGHITKKLSCCWDSSRYDKITDSGRSANPYCKPSNCI